MTPTFAIALAREYDQCQQINWMELNHWYQPHILDLLSQQKTLAHLHMETPEGTDPEPTPGMLTAHIFGRTEYEVHDTPY